MLDFHKSYTCFNSHRLSTWLTALNQCCLSKYTCRLKETAVWSQFIVCWTHCKVIYLGWHWLQLMIGFLKFDTSVASLRSFVKMSNNLILCRFILWFYWKCLGKQRAAHLTTHKGRKKKLFTAMINTESGQISREQWHLVFLRTKFLSSRSEFWMTTWDRFCIPSYSIPSLTFWQWVRVVTRFAC